MTTIKSCVTCPSFVAAEDHERQKKAFRKLVGVPMCGRYGHVLGTHGSVNGETVQHYGTSCPDHGDPAGTPVMILPRVVEADPGSLLGGPDNVGTCTGCENMVLSNAVQDSFGLPVPLCRAKGTLIFSTTKEADGCPLAKLGTPSASTAGLSLIKELRPDFRMDDEIKLRALMGSLDVVEPTEYETDLPVADDDVEAGIRAWRKITDKRGKDYYLPIFRRDYFTEAEQQEIPKTGVPFGSGGPPDLYVDYNGLLVRFLKDSYTLNETLCLTGQPGNGKTQFGVYLAWCMQVPFTKFSIKPDMNVEDFIGHPSVDPAKGDYFSLGRLPKAVSRPGVVISDEYNAGPDDVYFFYRDLIDAERVQINYAGGTTVKKHDYCFHLVTINPAWDMANIGTRELAAPDVSRLSYKWVAPPPEPIAKHIIKQRCAEDGYEVGDEVINQIMAVARDIEALRKQGVYPYAWGLRETIKVVRKTDHDELVDAFKSAILDYIDPEVAKLVLKSIGDIVGENYVVDEDDYTDPF
jgi:MoxR-like ATPase